MIGKSAFERLIKELNQNARVQLWLDQAKGLRHAEIQPSGLGFPAGQQQP